MISKLFSIFSRRRKKEEKMEESLEVENKIIREVRYPIVGDLQTQTDIQYILQVINSKIDTLLAKVDNLSLRLSNLEQIIYNFFYRR